MPLYIITIFEQGIYKIILQVLTQLETITVNVPTYVKE